MPERSSATPDGISTANLAAKTVLAIILASALSVSRPAAGLAETTPGVPLAQPHFRADAPIPVKPAKKKHKSTKKKASKPAEAKISSKLLSTADNTALTDALNEADRKNWPEAMRHRLRLDNKAAAKFVLWYRLTTKDSGATLAEIVAFKEQNPDWPRMALLSLRAEDAVLSYPMSNKDLISWFSANPPRTGEGRIRYGKALIASGQTDEGKKWIQRAWAENDFSSSRQREILAQFQAYLTTSTHKARLDRLLWDRRTTDARTTAALIGNNAEALADARIRLMTRSNSAPGAVARVPSAMQDDAGLLFDRIRYERKLGNDDATVPLILTAPGLPHQMVDPDAWWLERKIAARVALSNGQYQDAYDIVSKHGLTDGGDFADAEFLAGWIALQFLNKPDKAMAHFRKLKNAVSTPISTARADYWAGRAASAKGDKKNAELYYHLAAQNPTTFYGQLGTSALAHLQGKEARLHLPNDPKPTSAEIAAFKKLELVRVAQILHDLNRDDQAWSFMLHLADTLKEPQQLVQLADMALTFNDHKLSLRIAKTASQRNIMLPQRAYPVSYMPAFTPRGPAVEKALVFGLSRQESEFDPAAKSPVGARGLMQLMPATAKMVARQINVPYSRSRLTTDPAYNAMLGSAHLGDLIGDFNGSYIMSVAAYNAGATRVGQWQEQYGDPRSSTIDPIDWIENIPFSETRNYVQRVMENLEVYRTRLSGSAQKIRISDDIRRNTGAPITTPAPVIAGAPAVSTTPVAEAENTATLPDNLPLPRAKRNFAKP